MKRFFRVLKILAISMLALLLFVVVSVAAFLELSPEFGTSPAEDEMQKLAGSATYREGKFENQIPTSMELGFGETLSLARKFLFDRSAALEPDGALPLVKLDSAGVADRGEDVARLTWFGHSACLLEIDGKKIFLDPMLGQHAGPLPAFSPKRFFPDLPLDIEKLPYLDAVVISHDHYDHLDYGSIRKLMHKVGHFYVPLGVGAHLLSWGVPKEKITELSWWQEARLDDFTFVCTPARHFSGRGITRNKTLWASWIVHSPSRRFFFSGDSGYGPHFKEIGDRLGPFDFVMMECGQYNTLWREIHMMPEETVQAALDVRGKLLLPIHWGAFTLALHSWTDPIYRVSAEAERRHVLLTTPRVGEVVHLGADTFPKDRWW